MKELEDSSVTKIEHGYPKLCKLKGNKEMRRALVDKLLKTIATLRKIVMGDHDDREQRIYVEYLYARYLRLYVVTASNLGADI